MEGEQRMETTNGGCRSEKERERGRRENKRQERGNAYCIEGGRRKTVEGRCRLEKGEKRRWCRLEKEGEERRENRE